MNVIKQLSKSFIRLPAIGQGMGDYSWNDDNIEIIRKGIDLGMNFIDTAEGYDKGRSEEIVGKAIEDIREKVIIGTKFSSEHSSYDDIIKAADRSLHRLKTDYIDLYQLHWPNPSIPLKETMSAIERLIEEGKVKYIGMCNLSLRELQKAQSVLTNEKIVSLQIEYNLFDRIIEKDIIPFCDQNKIMIIAYSPLDQGRIVDGNIRRSLLENIAIKYNKTISQIALRWLISKPSVVAIPKAKNIAHIKENASSADFDIDKKDIRYIDITFKRPIIKVSPDRIRVSVQGQGNRLVYQTIEESRENKLDYVPSPIDLSKSIIEDDNIKPVRLIKTLDTTGKYDYDLVEGRIRYWAWVIAYNNVPIPSYIREDWP